MSATTSDITAALAGYVNGVGDLIFAIVPTLMLASITLFGLFFGIRYGLKWLRKALGGRA